jgi:hypothetical protein
MMKRLVMFFPLWLALATMLWAGTQEMRYQTPLATTWMQGLVGWWTFDTQDMWGRIASDRSGRSNHGLLMDSPARAIGKIGQGLRFDGADDYVNAGNGPSLTGMTALTLSALVKTSGTSGYIVAKTGVGYQYQWGMLVSSGNLFGIAWEVSGGTHLLASGGTINDGQWHLATVTIVNNARIDIYIDAVVVASSTTVDLAWNTNGTGNVNIGRIPDNAVYLNGLIDDVRIYNRALSAQEVSLLYRYSLQQYELAQFFSVVERLPTFLSQAGRRHRGRVY